MDRSSTLVVAQYAMDEAPAQTRRLLTWPAALALIFLSPFVGEMISGSTPPLPIALPLRA
jgi:hypothetical protein